MHEEKESASVANELLLDMVKNQRNNMSNFVRVFVVVVVCYTLILVSMIVGFFVYEVQRKTIATTITEQEVDRVSSSIDDIVQEVYINVETPGSKTRSTKEV